MLQSLRARLEAACVDPARVQTERRTQNKREHRSCAQREPLERPRNPERHFRRGHRFRVDDHVGQLAGGFCDGRIFGSPIEALASFQSHLAVLHTHLDAVAVELDFVDPASAEGGRFRVSQSCGAMKSGSPRGTTAFDFFSRSAMRFSAAMPLRLFQTASPALCRQDAIGWRSPILEVKGTM